ncbi:MAG TPA: hypothetical protein VHT25_10295 [Solirubrobacteraceae bacterium]|nr:hypothetical protein [Solirubrobacteraceae bacterium]
MPENGANDKPVAWLVSATATIALLLSAVGIGTGDVPHVLRNHPLLAGLLFAAVIVGSLIGAWGAAHVKAGLSGHTQLVVSAIILASAAILALITGVVSATDKSDPGITTAIITNSQKQQALRFGVKDSGLKSTDKMTIKVTALTYILGNDKPLRTSLYAESLGPSYAGDIDQQAEVPVPPAPANDLEVQAGIAQLAECNGGPEATTTKVEQPGCSRLHVGRLFEKPQLTTAWRNDRHNGAGLYIHVRARDLGEHRVVLRVFDAVAHHTILTANWPAPANGLISKSITAIVPRRIRRLCVATSTTQGTPTCSPPAGSGTAFVKERAPGP